MLQYECPKGHKYGIGCYGEDLTNGIWRKGTTGKCPQCKGEKTLKAMRKERDSFVQPPLTQNEIDGIGV